MSPSYLAGIILMKRLSVRLSLVGVVVAIGVVALVLSLRSGRSKQAQGGEKPEKQEQTQNESAEPQTPKPIPGTSEDTEPVSLAPESLSEKGFRFDSAPTSDDVRSFTPQNSSGSASDRGVDSHDVELEGRKPPVFVPSNPYGLQDSSANVSETTRDSAESARVTIGFSDGNDGPDGENETTSSSLPRNSEQLDSESAYVGMSDRSEQEQLSNMGYQRADSQDGHGEESSESSRQGGYLVPRGVDADRTDGLAGRNSSMALSGYESIADAAGAGGGTSSPLVADSTDRGTTGDQPEARLSAGRENTREISAEQASPYALPPSPGRDTYGAAPPASNQIVEQANSAARANGPNSTYVQAASDDMPANPTRPEPIPLAVDEQLNPYGTGVNDLAADAGVAGDGVGVPGDTHLEGIQSPTLVLQKTAPPEVQVGRPASFEIRVRNAGSVTAHQVTVVDEVPQGTQLLNASPRFDEAASGRMMWQVGTLQPGEETTIKVELLPLVEGEIGSVAQVAFQAQASARSICTKPVLSVKHSATPQQVLIGQDVTLSITLSNTGSGAAANVVLEEDVPDGLSHPAGKELEYEVGTLRPGEVKTLRLTLHAEQPGVAYNHLLLRGDGNLLAEDESEIHVVAPELQVALRGPKLRYLERQAIFEVFLANPGTASARDLELVAYLPKGMEYVAANNRGQYDRQEHAVYWSLEELPANKQGSVQLTTLPVDTGDQKLRVEARGDLGISHAFEHTVTVESLAELLFTIADAADPIEVGSDTVYEIKITNSGSKTDTNVQLAAALPAGLQPLDGEGPTRGTVEGQQMVFEPLARLAPKETVTYRVSARGAVAGDHLLRVQVTSDEVQTPVTKEESTRVYADE